MSAFFCSCTRLGRWGISEGAGTWPVSRRQHLHNHRAWWAGRHSKRTAGLEWVSGASNEPQKPCHESTRVATWLHWRHGAYNSSSKLLPLETGPFVGCASICDFCSIRIWDLEHLQNRFAWWAHVFRGKYSSYNYHYRHQSLGRWHALLLVLAYLPVFTVARPWLWVEEGARDGDNDGSRRRR